MIIYDDGFLRELDDSRMCYIGGRLGSGKTLLAFELAERYLLSGYRLISQTSSVWNDDPALVTADELGRRKCVFIIDEAGLYFRRAQTAGYLASFARKQDFYLIFSSRKAPHADLCDLSIYLYFDLFKFFLIPLKIWRWERYNVSKSYHGFLFQTAWWGYYGVYNTLDPGDPPDEIVEIVKSWTHEFFQKYGRRYRPGDILSPLATSGGGDDDVELVNELSSAIRSLKTSKK